MRISDWSSDVCSSDLLDLARQIEVARLGSAELARAGARQRARRHQFDYAVHARHRADTLPNLVAQPLALRIVGRAALDEYRSEERRVGKECVRQSRSRWSPYH